MKIHLYTLLRIGLTTSCSTSDTKLERALEQSGTNRKELEKVLSGLQQENLKINEMYHLL